MYDRLCDTTCITQLECEWVCVGVGGCTRVSADVAVAWRGGCMGDRRACTCSCRCRGGWCSTHRMAWCLLRPPTSMGDGSACTCVCMSLQVQRWVVCEWTQAAMPPKSHRSGACSAHPLAWEMEVPAQCACMGGVHVHGCMMCMCISMPLGLVQNSRVVPSLAHLEHTRSHTACMRSACAVLQACKQLACMCTLRAWQQSGCYLQCATPMPRPAAHLKWAWAPWRGTACRCPSLRCPALLRSHPG